MCALVSEGGGISFMLFCLIMVCVCIYTVHNIMYDASILCRHGIYALWFPIREDRKTKLSLFEIGCIDVPFVLHNH